MSVIKCDFSSSNLDFITFAVVSKFRMLIAFLESKLEFGTKVCGSVIYSLDVVILGIGFSMDASSVTSSTNFLLKVLSKSVSCFFIFSFFD